MNNLSLVQKNNKSKSSINTKRNISARPKAPVCNDRYIRQTGIDDVEKLLENLPMHIPLDAIRMIDREISGLLAHQQSPVFHDYRTFASIVFRSGLEYTDCGKDIILILNSRNVTVKNAGKEHQIDIPPRLKNPEKGVVQIIRYPLAWKLFIERGRILTLLIEEENGKWQENLTANDMALTILKTYNPCLFEELYPERNSLPRIAALI